MSFVAINSQSLRTSFQDEYQKFFEHCDVIVSSPGLTTIAGEKVWMYPHSASMISLLIPRRVHIGFKHRKKDGRGIKLTKSFVLEESQAIDKNLRTIPTGPWPHPKEDQGLFDFALFWVTELIKSKSRLMLDIDLYIWTEWKSETGLGWSGAFAAALAAGVLLSSGTISENSMIWKHPTKQTKEFGEILKLGWIVEAILHGGRANGSAVCAPILGSTLPTFYRAPNIPRVWSIYKTTSDPTKTDLMGPSQTKERAKRSQLFYDYLDWTVDSCPKDESAKSRDQQEIWRRMFDGSSLFIIHTNVKKSSSNTNIRERDRKTREELGESPDLSSVYEALSHVSHFVEAQFKALSDCVNSQLWNVSDIDFYWKKIIPAIGAIRNLNASLGFTFPVAEEIFGRIRSEVGGNVIEPPIDGKPSGAGTGGNLIVFARPGIEERRNGLYQCIKQLRERHTQLYKDSLGESSISIMYDSKFDGLQTHGLVLERF